jgi:hypothetical protein
MGQRMGFVGTKQKESDRGYCSEVSLYQAKNCEGCPMRGGCHKAKGNRVIEINHNLQRHKQIARENLTSERGLMHRSRRPIEPEAVFGQVKSNRGFKRFRLRGLDGVAVEFGLICIAVNLSKMIKKAVNRTINGPESIFPACEKLFQCLKIEIKTWKSKMCFQNLIFQ